MLENIKLAELSEDELMNDNRSYWESYFSDSEFENDPNTVQSAGNTSNISTTDATRNESMMELFSSNDDSDIASTSNFVDHNWKSVETTYTSPSDINFSESSGISNSITLNKELLPVQFFAVCDRAYKKDYGHRNKQRC